MKKLAYLVVIDLPRNFNVEKVDWKLRQALLVETLYKLGQHCDVSIKRHVPAETEPLPPSVTARSLLSQEAGV